MHIIDLIDTDKETLEAIEERLKLAKCIKRFTDKMATKITKYLGDRVGWAEEENAANMHAAMIKAFEDGDYVSVANYAMFLNNQGYKPGRSVSN